MKVAILVLVVIGALSVIASGVWVAFALISAISWHRAEPTAPRLPTEKDSARREPKSGD
jgi:hypothetical protein